LLAQQVRGAIAGGVDVVQIRERGLDAVEYVAFIRDCVALTRGGRCRIVVNDRLDLAIAADAHGVHLRETSVPIEAARQLAHKEFLVGRSVHSPDTAAAMRTADYLIVGSVFETASKPGLTTPLGLSGLRAVRAAAVPCPVWAIGGVTLARLPALKTCGIQGVAAIDAFLPPDATHDVAGDVEKLTTTLRFSLDRRG
jgi:thiamine-phosphate pyrophosphorylase